MDLMLPKLFKALKAAGASEDEAQDAATEVADFKRQIEGIKSDLRLLTWMVGFNLALTIALLGSGISFAINFSSKLSAIEAIVKNIVH